MVKYSCEKCGKSFKQKGHYTNHINRKNPCENIKDKIEKIVEEKVNEILDKKNKKIKYIDLFCGIGGFHQALDKLNCECIFACDIDKKCRENYKENYDLEPFDDIKKINIDDIKDFDILCGGFPCQSFSNAGKKKSFSDNRGLLFDEIIRIAKDKKPKFMFLENVKHILKIGDGEVVKYIKEQILNIGYNLQIFNVSPHKYGIPQQRERVFFVCIRNDIYNKKDIVLPEEKKDICLDNIFKSTDIIDKKYYIDGDILKCLQAWDEMIKIFDIDEKISPTIMINEHYNNHTIDDFNNYADWRKNYINANKPLINKYKKKWDKWYNKHKDILQKKEIYGKLEWQVGKIKKNDSIFNYFIQIRQSGIRVKKAEYFPTLVAISQIPIYGKEKRYITPRECARLQSFPENYIIDKNDKNSYKQFGNSVNVDNVHMVIKSTLDAYNFLSIFNNLNIKSILDKTDNNSILDKQDNVEQKPKRKISIQIKNYEKLYLEEKEINNNLKVHLEHKNNKLYNLKLKEREREDKVKLLSYTNSQTAKNGYKEEELICKDLNSELIKKAFIPMLGNNYNECHRITGNHKCDIQSDNKILRGQVKKYKKGQFQQLDRCWTSSFIKNIPELNEVSQILKDLFEYPLLLNGTHVDKSKNIKKLCNYNYSQEILDNFLDLLNKCKKQILKHAFYGNNLEIRPKYLFGIEYENVKRNKIVVFKIYDIIKYLEKLNFKISPKKTAILLGDDSTISLQRKGGDSGKKSSNQLQTKLILSNLIDKVPILEYKL